MASPDLHQQLLDVLDPEDPRAGWRVVRAVVELHAPVASYGGADCGGCDKAHDRQEPATWPCTTVRTIADRLGIGED